MQRQADIDKLQTVNLAADLKVLEIMYAKKIQRREQLGKFLCTKVCGLKHWANIRTFPGHVNCNAEGRRCVMW